MAKTNIPQRGKDLIKQQENKLNSKQTALLLVESAESDDFF